MSVAFHGSSRVSSRVLVLRACHAQSCYEEAMCYYMLDDANTDQIVDRVRTGCARSFESFL